MKSSLIQGLNEKDVKAVLNQITLNAFMFPTLFPFKFTPTLTFKTLAGEQGIPVMADVVSFNSSAPRKTRQVISKFQGDIPKIEIARIKEETDLNEYANLLHYANTTEGARALVEWIYEDVEFCFTGVNARLEWMALQALSTGKITLTKANNNAVVTKTDIDFLVPATHKKKVSTVWSAVNASTSKPITDIKAIVKLAKAAGYPVKYMIMTPTTFDNLAISAETIAFCASWVVLATNLATLPSLASVNAALAGSGLPTIILADTYVTIETTAGARSSVNPWEEANVTFLPSLNCGNTYHAPLADELVTESAALKVKRNHVLIKKFSEEDPVVEVTKGLANAMPAWATSQLSYILDTDTADD